MGQKTSTITQKEVVKMSVGLCQMKITHEAQISIMKSILSNMPLQGDEWGFCIEHTVGEALANLGKVNASASVSWCGTSSVFEVIIASESYLDFYPKLCAMLDFAKECVERGISCNFLEDEHGLGHFMMAALTSECYYTQEGTLVLLYKEIKKPSLDCLKLVSM